MSEPFYIRKQLKEMVLALLKESDLALSDDIIESIVEKVCIHCLLLINNNFNTGLYWSYLFNYFLFRRSKKQTVKVTVELTKKNGKNM